jgi:hypothetical protein
VSSSDNNLDLLTASLRADMGDLGAFVESLAAKLEQALPGRVRVERRRDGMFGSKLVRRIALDAGGQRLELAYQHGSLETKCSRMSGGIVLKSETVDTETWLAALGEALTEEARRSETTRRALERLLIQ